MTIPRSYDRIMLRRKSVYVNECHEGQFIGGDWGVGLGWTIKLLENVRDFTQQYNPVFPGRDQVGYKLSNN